MSEDGQLRLADLLAFLQSLSGALTRADYSVSHMRSVYPRVISLSQNSPAEITVELHRLSDKKGAPISAVDYRPQIVDRFFAAPEIHNDVEVERVGRGLVWAYKEMSALIGHQRVARARVFSNGKSVTLTPELNTRLAHLLTPEQSAQGTIDGRLEAINLHGGRNVFVIYPLVGPKRLTCHFPEILSRDAIAAISRRVSVIGTLKYREGAPYPHAIEVENLEVFPPQDTLPLLSELRGIAPNATGDLTSEDFIRRLRDGWNES